MYQIRSTQVKAARALLGWSQDDLARKASVSRTTVRSLEDGFAIRNGTMNEIRNILEKAGIEFLENEGVRRRPNGARVYKGADSCERFFDEVAQTIKEQGGDVIAIIKSQAIMARSSGINGHNNLERLEMLCAATEVKCLFSEASAPSFIMPPVQFRTLSKGNGDPSCYFVYGDKRAEIVFDGHMDFIFVIYDGAASLAQEYRKYFLSLWETALPLSIPNNISVRRRRTSA